MRFWIIFRRRFFRASWKQSQKCSKQNEEQSLLVHKNLYLLTFHKEQMELGLWDRNPLSQKGNLVLLHILDGFENRKASQKMEMSRRMYHHWWRTSLPKSLEITWISEDVAPKWLEGILWTCSLLLCYMKLTGPQESSEQ